MKIWEYKDIEQEYLIPFVNECNRTKEEWTCFYHINQCIVRRLGGIEIPSLSCLQ